MARYSCISRARKYRLAVTLLVFAACGQVDSQPNDGTVCSPTTLIEQGQLEFWLFEVEHEDICESSLEAVQLHAAWVSENWALGPEGPIQYELFETRQDCWPCASGAGACGEEGRLATTRMPDRHEVAHAAHGSNCTSFIEEGWATLYANPLENDVIVGGLEDAAVAIETAGRLPGEYYPLAARFVAFVIEAWGIGAVHELCELRLASKAEFDAGLHQVLGLSLEETQLALDAYPAWSLGQLRQDLACERDASLSAPFSSTVEVGCDGNGVEGLLGHLAWNEVVVDFGEGGSHELTIETGEPLELWVEIRSCTREGLASPYYSADLIHPRPTVPADILLFDLPGGRHVVRILDHNSRTDLTVSVSATSWP